MDIIKLRENMLRDGELNDKKEDLMKQFHDKDFELINIYESQNDEIQKILLSISESLVSQFLEFFRQNNFEIKICDNTYHIYPDVNSSSFIAFTVVNNSNYELTINHKLYTLQLKQTLDTSNNQCLIPLDPLNMDTEFKNLVNSTSTVKSMEDVINKIDLYIKDVKYNHELVKTATYTISSSQHEFSSDEYDTFVHMFKCLIY